MKFICILIVILFSIQCYSQELTEKPNILFILVDDLGQHQLGSYGSTFYETPCIDKLAKEGMKFNNAYAAASICSPTRASIMTGKYPARLHLTNYIPAASKLYRKLLAPNWKKHLPLEEVTLAESLQKAGYATGHFGKWHLNINKKYSEHRLGDPASQGFDDVFTSHKPNAGSASIYNEDWHHVKEITERAISFIENNKSKPFFCYVSHNSIHNPEIEKENLVKKYSNKPGAKKSGNLNPVQAAMLETLDKSVKTILDKLEELKIANNTIVVFFSDNGHLGPKDGKLFRGSKGDLYEGGIRMPLIIKWPKVIKSSSLCEEVVISNDFFSTFNEIANVSSSSDVDGLSLLPLLNDSEAKLNREAVYWHFPHYHISGIAPQGAMRMGRYKLIEWFEKSSYGETDAFELYDLIDDPREQKNLADLMPDVTSKLKKNLSLWRKSVGAQMMTMQDEK
ncbi:MAG: sulfatase [Melioribacteraceae bacterium]